MNREQKEYIAFWILVLVLSVGIWTALVWAVVTLINNWK